MPSPRLHTRHHQGPPPLVWIIDSDYTGELNARIGLAERLGHPYDIVPLPAADPQAYQHALKQRYARSTHDGPRQVVVISGTGEETTADIADLKALFAGRLFTVYLASILPDEPHPRLGEYDLIASTQLRGDNIVPLVGVPHKLTHASLAAAHHRHASAFTGLPRPVIGLLVGGNTRYCDGFTAAHAAGLAQRVAGIARSLAGSVAVSNSRRTPPPALDALLEGLAGLPQRFFDWQQSAPGLYHALLAHADMFIVTADSLSMCSEAAYTGKPLLVDLCEEATESYHRDIVGKLIDYGAAKPLTGHYAPWDYAPPDPTAAVAEAIHALLKRDMAV